ncbi:hypothetical protein NLC29_02605 [Candidatus Aminicenantes bacterium AH-873-B07]|nr:hypothetical protein [Candidatus Aminicenantes bacterium AH-873-B07]
MKKLGLLLCILFVILSYNNLIQSQTLRANEAAIFLRNGNMVIGKIIDISSTRRVLQLKDGTEIKLINIWMINFINTKWNFPEERRQITTADHYFFLKNGNIIYGRIVDFSTNLRVFELDTGEKIKIGAIRRIYLSKSVPYRLRRQIEEKEVTIFLYSGNVITGQIVDFSADRQILILKSGNEINLSTIQMINFINKERNFPSEINRIVNPRYYYIFLKDGSMITGIIVNFDSKAFILASGDRININSIKRIYFPKIIPPLKKKDY